MKTAVVHARIEPQTKQKAEGVLRKLGLTPTATLEKSRRGEDIEEFESLEAMFKNWEK